VRVTAADIQRAGGLAKWQQQQAQQSPPRPSVSATQRKPILAQARTPHPGRTYRTEGMNQTEARYADHLAALERKGRVVGWDYEGFKLRLADKTFYTPDFLVILADGRIELHEVKGHWEDDARVKIKVAAAQKPWFTFVAVKWVKGGWEYERF
jgi:hypothetical protein